MRLLRLDQSSKVIVRLMSLGKSESRGFGPLEGRASGMHTGPRWKGCREMKGTGMRKEVTDSRFGC